MLQSRAATFGVAVAGSRIRSVFLCVQSGRVDSTSCQDPHFFSNVSACLTSFAMSARSHSVADSSPSRRGEACGL